MPAQAAMMYAQDFNPRSLAGATTIKFHLFITSKISIHAPLRERRPEFLGSHSSMIFQSTLPCGSDLATRLQAVS